MAGTIACDLFTVPTVAFKILYAFVVLHHGSRRILQAGVTEHPTAEWTAQNLVEAVGDHETLNLTHLIRDRDTIFGDVFSRKADALGLEEVVTPKASPWCRFAERIIGTIRRECTDHIIPFDERHLLRVVKEFAAYYNADRCRHHMRPMDIRRTPPAIVPLVRATHNDLPMVVGQVSPSRHGRSLR